MKKVLVAVVVFHFSLVVVAQEVEHVTVSGNELLDFIAKEGYKYAGFQRGKVYFNNSDSGGGRLNYNYLLQTMQFIGPKGDTLVFADEKMVKYVTIGPDTFFYNNGFYEKLDGKGALTLTKRHILKGTEAQKLGAFGKSAVTTSITSDDMLRNNSAPMKLNINEEFRFSKQTFFYISTAGKQFVELNKKNVPRLFSGKAGAVNEYIETNKLSLHKEADVLNLFGFLKQVI